MSTKIKPKSIINFLFTYSTTAGAKGGSEETYAQDRVLIRLYINAIAFFAFMCIVTVATILGIAFYSFTPDSVERTETLKLLLLPAYSVITIFFPSPLAMLMMNILIYGITWSTLFSMI